MDDAMYPGYFALVMATGIVAVGAEQRGLGVLADVLYVVAAGAFVLLAALLAARIVRYPRAFAADLLAHARGFAFLTTVAGTNVLASASIVVHGWWGLAWGLWWASIALWACLVYVTLIARSSEVIEPLAMQAAGEAESGEVGLLARGRLVRGGQPRHLDTVYRCSGTA